ncbi:uncharacterized protein LOC132730175 [Ruditapes philippinarum]|uniref:uncharacterized protein LOC132730175 n=1 Tax=Ruditapes philippinarum TaxID=129788 RepID=UPI00295AA884|nr:uncharacterized protein LOC132730175 [Ruditapes philippinarum]
MWKHVIGTDFADEIKDQTSELHKENSQTWKNGRRLVEFDVLLTNLRLCKSCRHGPVPFIENNICGELQQGLSGYLYVRCSDCGYVNRVAHGKTHRVKRKGMPCFDVNTKLGTAMIDSLGGPVRVNNVLSALNLKTISDKNLQKMEKRAGEVIECLAEESTSTAAKEVYRKEMEDIAHQESVEALTVMKDIIEDLGVCPLPDSSPSVRLHLQGDLCDDKDSWSDDSEDSNSHIQMAFHVETNHDVMSLKFEKNATKVCQTPVAPAKQQSSTMKTPVTPAKEQSSTMKTPVTRAKEQSSTMKTPVTPAKEQSSTMKTPVTPAKEQSSTMKTSAALKYRHS